jgi:hypothetical protein
LAALTYNLKKYLTLISKKAVTKAIAMPTKSENALYSYFPQILPLYRLFLSDLSLRFGITEIYVQKRLPVKRAVLKSKF